jgi:hypothetical protein
MSPGTENESAGRYLQWHATAGQRDRELKEVRRLFNAAASAPFPGAEARRAAQEAIQRVREMEEEARRWHARHTNPSTDPTEYPSVSLATKLASGNLVLKGHWPLAAGSPTSVLLNPKVPDTSSRPQASTPLTEVQECRILWEMTVEPPADTSVPRQPRSFNLPPRKASNLCRYLKEGREFGTQSEASGERHDGWQNWLNSHRL